MWFYVSLAAYYLDKAAFTSRVAKVVAEHKLQMESKRIGWEVSTVRCLSALLVWLWVGVEINYFEIIDFISVFILKISPNTPPPPRRGPCTSHVAASRAPFYPNHRYFADGSVRQCISPLYICTWRFPPNFLHIPWFLCVISHFCSTNSFSCNFLSSSFKEQHQLK